MLSSAQTHSHTTHQLIQSQQESTTTLTYTTPKRPVSPLDIPEILENILSNVQGITLTRTAILVCREWFLMVRHRLIRQTDWDNTWPSKDLDKALRRIPTTTRLRCSFAKSTLAGDEHARKLWRALEDHHLQHRIQLHQPRQRRHSQSRKQQRGGDESISSEVAEALEKTIVRDLIVDGYVHHHTILPYGLSGLPSLKVLKIHTNQEAKFYMSRILASLPDLEVLHIRSTCALDLSEPWLQSIGDRYSKKLQSLVLGNALVHQSSFEQLLSASPCLKELKLMIRRFPGRIDPNFNMTRFYALFRSFIENLEVFQFGNDRKIAMQESDSENEDEDEDEDGDEDGNEARRGVWNGDMHLMLTGCCTSTDWAFFGHKLPFEIESLTDFPNRVTALEILGPCDTLHDILCYSPQILHVKAPWVNLQTYHLDLHLCWDHGDGRMIDFGCSTMSDAPKIWACRGLQTLHIGARFYDHHAPGFNDFSLYVFGYIARVCPMLQDLALFGPESKVTSNGYLSTGDTFRLDLAGGFCLLTHLKHLRYLRIGELYVDPFVRPIDVEWMLPSGRSTAKKQERAEILTRWSTCVMQDRELQKQDKQPREPQLFGSSLEIPGLEPELRHSLRYLGHRLDVIETLAALDEQDGFNCWPELDRISIYGSNSFGQPLEKEVERLLAPLAPVTNSRQRPPLQSKSLLQKE